MSKKRIHIDELFRRGLGNMQMPVAGDDWAVMQAQLAAAQQKRKRRRAFWWWLFGLLLVVGGSLSVYSLVSNKEENNVPLVVNEKEVDNSLPNNTANNSIEKETAAPESTSTTQDDVNKNQDSNNANTDLNDNSNQTTDSRPKSTKGKQANTPKPATNNDNSQTKNQSADNDINKELLQKNSDNTPEKDTEGTNTDNTHQPNDENPIPPAPAANQQTVVYTATDSVLDDNNSGEEAEQATAKVAAVPPLPTKVLKKLPIIQLGLGFVPTFVNWQTPQNTRYGQILKQGGKSVSGLGINFSADFRITNKWWIGSGVDVSNINSRGNYNYTHQIYDSIPVLGPGGEIKGYFYTNFRDTAHNYNLHSTYTFITIPVQAWYNIPLNQKTGILLGSNVQFHYLAMAKGEYINPNTLFSQKATVNDDQLRKLNFSVAIQMGYYYSINDKWRFEGVLQMQQMGKSMFSNSVGADVRLQRIGLNVGIVYNLMRKKGE